MTQRPTLAQRGTLVLRSWRPVLLAAALALALGSGFAPLRPAALVLAGTAETMEAKILSLINADRVAVGLVPLRLHSGLVDLAGARATSFATKATIVHSAAGCLSCQLDSRGIQWYANGEASGASGYPWGDQAVASLYKAWKGSSLHWGLLMSKTFNYVGIGVAYRSANSNTYASIVFTESVDQSRPWAQMVSTSTAGTLVYWSWRGGDAALQTHTAGVKNFDVQYRVDNGAWTSIRAKTTATSIKLTDRAHGHWYGLRVMSRDNRLNVSLWTPELRVWVP